MARSVWLQMDEKYPRWNKISEVHYWLAEVYFEENEFSKGIAYAIQSKNSKADGLIDSYLANVTDIELLQTLYEEYPSNKIVASSLAQAISKQSLSERNYQLIGELIKKFDFSSEYFGLPDVGQSQLKESYNVAVMLPFLFESLENTRRIERNKFVLDLYKGVKIAVEELNSETQVVNLFPYDTRRSGEETEKILEREELKAMDLIIGPLYPDPFKLTSDFCYKNKINMINPVSSNSAIIENNPFSFLLKPTHELRALKAAEFAIDSMTHKMNAMILFDKTEKDSLMAEIYASELRSAGFEPLLKLGLDEDNIRKFHALITETYEFKLTQEEADSISELSERVVKESIPEGEEDSIYLYEERLVIERDSIGHIYVASSKPLHASMSISAVEIRRDRIPIIGRYDWLNYDMITFDQMERLGVYYIAADYLVDERESYSTFRKSFVSKYGEVPSFNSMLGYEAMSYTGAMLQKYGNYFQAGFAQEGFVEGKILYGLDYSYLNCNKVVPILQLKSSQLQIVNSENE